MHRYRSHTCAQLRKAEVGQTVRLSGWVHRVRDHGGLLFIDLRDHYGLTQIVADPDSPAFKVAETVRGEWVIRVDGEVKARTPETVNANLPTGEIEVFAREIEVLSAANAEIAVGACGPCYGTLAPLEGDEVCIATSTRNEMGRMGSESATVLLSNAAVAAASAITGEITDPLALKAGAR